MKYFIDRLEEEEDLKRLPSYRRLVRQYNKTGVIMMQYEVKIEEKLKAPRLRTLNTMLAKPVVKSMPAGQLVVNFDPYLLSFLHESKKLCKLDIKLPSVTQFMLTKKDWFHDFQDMIGMMIDRYQEAVTLIHPELKKLFSPHLIVLRSSLDPALCDINWSYKEWDELAAERMKDISDFSDLINRANDIYENRIEKTLESIPNIQLYELHEKGPRILNVFLEIVKDKCKRAAKEIDKKSNIVEDAVDDLINLALDGNKNSKMESNEADEKVDDSKSPLMAMNSKSISVDESANNCISVMNVFNSQHLSTIHTTAKELRKVSSKKVVDKLILLVRVSLRALAKHFDSSKVEAKTAYRKFDYEENVEKGQTVFVLNAYLDFPNIQVKPSIDEVQNVLNFVGKIIISVAKGVGQWRQIKRRDGNIPGFVPNCESNKEKKLYNPIKVEIPLIEEKQSNFFKAVSESKEATKGVSLLANALSNFPMDLAQFNSIWYKYSEVWTIEKENFMKEMMSKKP